MAFHIKNPETEALARKLALAKGTSVTDAVHQALQSEYQRVTARSADMEAALSLVRDFQAKGNRAAGAPVDRDFIDSLYD
jgi:antitoxin VapB